MRFSSCFTVKRNVQNLKRQQNAVDTVVPLMNGAIDTKEALRRKTKGHHHHQHPSHLPKLVTAQEKTHKEYRKQKGVLAMKTIYTVKDKPFTGTQ